MAEQDAAEKAAPDWERIEADYRAGVLSLREIAAPQGVAPATILKRAKKNGWTRDLAAKIKAKADAAVNRATVNATVNGATAVSEASIVEGVALAVATVRLAHRSDINRARSLTMRLLIELEAVSGNIPELVSLGEMLRQPDESGADRLNDIYRAVIGLPERAKTNKALVESLKHMIGMEREAYSMDEKKRDETPGEITISF